MDIALKIAAWERVGCGPGGAQPGYEGEGGLAEPGDIDTIYMLWGSSNSKSYERIRRLRRVDMKWVSLPKK